MDKEIIEYKGRTELAKRTKLEGVVIRSNCPHCDREQVRDLGSPGHYLSYPVTNQPITVHFYCGEEAGVDHPLVEWQTNVTVRVSLEVDDQITEVWSTDDTIESKLKESYKNENG